MRIEIDQEVPRYKSYAAERARGLYNVDAEDGGRFQLDVELPAEEGPESWKIGVVVGPSGTGKSSIARALSDEGYKIWTGGRWSKDKPIIEVLGDKDFAKATGGLASVGLGSVPSWLRPHHVLSTGEQFRADMAKLLMSGEKRVTLDEFTSVLDRQVAQVAAGAFAKGWRRGERQIVLVTCHYDILEWVDPDWVVDTAGGEKLAAEGERKVVRAEEASFQAATHQARYPGDRVVTLEI